MDKNLIKEMIVEYENMLITINRRLYILKTLLDEKMEPAAQPNNIKNEIEKRKIEILNEIQKIRQDAQNQVNINRTISPEINFPINNFLKR